MRNVGGNNYFDLCISSISGSVTCNGYAYSFDKSLMFGKLSLFNNKNLAGFSARAMRIFLF